VTHNPESRLLADRVVTIRDGRCGVSSAAGEAACDGPTLPAARPVS
jgi:hypothetical protein